jgi:hypothetical protein
VIQGAAIRIKMQKRDQAMEHQEDYARNYSTKTHSTDPNHEQDKMGIKLNQKSGI